MKALNELLAAISFFTRIPCWKLKSIPAESFKTMIYWWPATAWITALVTVAAWFAFSALLPTIVAVILSIGVRVLLTGGFHEDGLGDFFDGFGGGRTREDVLRIMKDSHAGSFSVLSLIFYTLLLVYVIASFPIEIIPLAIMVSDPLAKFLTSVMMQVLPYARNESESKSKTVYSKLMWWQIIVAAFFGLFPFIVFFRFNYWYALILPAITLLFMVRISKHKIQGYTGDVCGATALLCELSMLLALLISVNL